METLGYGVGTFAVVYLGYQFHRICTRLRICYNWIFSCGCLAVAEIPEESLTLAYSCGIGWVGCDTALVAQAQAVQAAVGRCCTREESSRITQCSKGGHCKPTVGVIHKRHFAVVHRAVELYGNCLLRRYRHIGVLTGVPTVVESRRSR